MADIKTLKEHPIADVVGRFVELKADGAEFLGCCPFHQEDTPSFTVVPNKGFYHCFGCGAHGDVVDFICQYHGIDPQQKGWLEQASIAMGDTSTPGPVAHYQKKTEEVPEWIPIVPVPEDAPKILLPGGSTCTIYNPKSDKSSQFKPTKVYSYKNSSGGIVGYVLRCQFPDGRKFTPQVTYCKNHDGSQKMWCIVSMPKPRPIYGLDELLKQPDKKKVVIVEGEKCKVAAAKLFPNYIALSWPGGTNGRKHVDWSPLIKYRVLLWPDNDDPGREAMQEIAAKLHQQDCHVVVLDTTRDSMPDGWDCADALADGWDDVKTTAWVNERARKYTPPSTAKPDPTPPQKPPEKKKPDLTVVGGKKGNAVPKEKEEDKPEHWHESWQTLALDLNHNGVPLNNLNNACKIVLQHKEFAGKVWYDEFHLKYFTSWNGDRREISDHDILTMTVFMQNFLGIRRMSDDTVKKAIVAAGRQIIRNEPREWLDSLKWDGQARIRDSLSKYFGADKSRYVMDASRNFWISMVARVMEPGCQVDNVVILESNQGLGKSSALRVIGGPYYAETAESMSNKDFLLLMQGRFLIEIGELEAFSKSEITKIKQMITCRTDRYRAPYGRSAEDHPRMCIFVGSTNEDAYLRDHTGGRRFWPVKCGQVIDQGRLQMDREQLFAEAVELYKDGEPWYKIEGAEAEQEKRRVADIWEDVIYEKAGMISNVDMAEVLKWLDIEVGKAGLAEQHRIGRCMRALGYEKQADGGGKSVKWIKRT